MLNFDRYLSRMFWSTVSPMPDQGITEKVSNFSSLPAWSSSAAQTMLSKGVMDQNTKQYLQIRECDQGRMCRLFEQILQPDTYSGKQQIYGHADHVSVSVGD